jgi:hypothetical protein
MLHAKKGIIFSIDAALAVVTALLLITAVLYFLGQNTVPHESVVLDSIARDSATVLEKDRTFRTAVEINSPTVIERYLNGLPSHICASVSLQTSASIEVMSTIKTGCTSGREKSRARRSFITTGLNSYYAIVEVWFNE